MEFKANKGDLLSALYWTQSIVEKRHTMPILANVLIESHKGEIRVIATDLEVGIRSAIKGDIAAEGEMSVNARKLYEIVREAPDEAVQIKRLDNDWVEIKSGKSIFKMVGISAKEFPQFPQFAVEKLTPVPVRILREMIEKTIFSVSTDETRHNLNGVYLEEGEKGMLKMVATDGHRLALIERGIGSMGLDKGVIIPRKGLSELKKLLDESEEGLAAIGFQENLGLVAKDNVHLFMRLIDEDFPDYTKVVPKNNPYAMKIAKDGFLQALRRVSILSSERYKGVKVEVKEGTMAISANNPDLGEAVEEMEADYNGKPLSIGFNARYLLDVLGVLGDGGEIEVNLKDEVSPGLLTSERDENYLYVVMPMRL